MPLCGATLDENESPPPEGSCEKILISGKAPREGTRPPMIRQELQPPLEAGSPDPAIFSQLQGCRGGLRRTGRPTPEG